MTTQEAAKLTAMLAAVYDVPAWQKERLRLFSMAIADLDYEPSAAAVQSWIGTRKERPQPSDIRDQCRQQLEASGAIPPTLEADEAWGRVVDGMTSIGRYRPFTDPDSTVCAIVSAMGWETLCMSDNQEADRAHFIRLYETRKKRAIADRLKAPGLKQWDDRLRIANTPRPRLDS